MERLLAGAKQRVVELEGETADNKILIKDMAGQVAALEARAGTLEEERDTLAAPLKIPGMKRVLTKVVHEDSHKQGGPLTEDQRRALTEWSQAVNAAFALIKRLTASADAQQ